MSLMPMLQRLLRIPQVLVPASEKDEDALRIGILGASFIARIAVVHAAQKLHNVEVVAVAARDLDKARSYASTHSIAAFHGGSDGYDALLARKDVDAIYIGLPTQLHRRWTLAALAAGKHVLVEKPVAANAEEAEEIRLAAKKAGKVVFEAGHYRYHPASERFRSIVQDSESTELGDFIQLEARFHMLDPKAWWSSKFSSSVEALSADERQQERIKNLDRWWYCADSLLWASGAKAAHLVSVEEGRFSMSANMVLELPSSDTKPRLIDAALHMSRDRLWPPYDWSIKAWGEGKKPELGNRKSVSWQRSKLLLSNFGFPFIWHAIDIKASDSSQRRQQFYGSGETTFEHQLQAFVAAVQDQSHDSENLEDHGRRFVATMRLVDDILKNANGAFPSLA
eukprot:TRINITY_DN22620_c0_g1_i1.p1 TRINITY_DN22620_c0_g1~~TRINITY_DN22620_c0_g1_i1.p1  ORF type:complete len:441 (+),score=107.29 TRINITY_DN22620_c0_g1_i1:136-1323(+)